MNTWLPVLISFLCFLGVMYLVFRMQRIRDEIKNLRAPRHGELEIVDTIDETEANLEYHIELAKCSACEDPNWWVRGFVKRTGVSTVTGEHTISGEPIPLWRLENVPDDPNDLGIGGPFEFGPFPTREDAMRTALHTIEAVR